jgi:hypothetical protein
LKALGPPSPEAGLPADIVAALKQSESYWSQRAQARTVDTHEQQVRQHEATARRLAFVTTFGFFLLIALLLVVVRYPGGAATVATGEQQFKDVLLTMTGVVGTGWAGIISFYFGSSVGSRLQSDTLGKIAQHGMDTPARKP